MDNYSTPSDQMCIEHQSNFLSFPVCIRAMSLMIAFHATVPEELRLPNSFCLTHLHTRDVIKLWQGILQEALP